MRPGQQIVFHGFRLDIGNQRLWREQHAVPLTPKAFALLQYLVQRPGQLVTKEDLLEAVWPETFVTDAVLKVASLNYAGRWATRSRRHDSSKRRSGAGYRFIGKVTIEPETERDDRSPSPSLVGRAPSWRSWRAGWSRHAAASGKSSSSRASQASARAPSSTRFCNRQADACWWHEGNAWSSTGESEAYLPWFDACARLCRDRPSFTGLLRTHAPMWLARMPSLLAKTERAALQREIAGATQAQMLREMAEAIEALTTEVPLVLALEDLHWSDHSTLNLMAYLARRTQPARLIVIGTFRPVDVIASGHPLQAVKHELEMHQQCTEVALAFLSEAAVAEYLACRFPDRQLPAELPRAIHTRTEGNALFMVNVVDELARAVLDRDAETFAPDGPGGGGPRRAGRHPPHGRAASRAAE